MTINRRRYERFHLPLGYTEVKVRAGGGDWLEGHAYDISEGGVRLELDREIEPGSSVLMRIALPRGQAPLAERDPDLCEVEAEANIVWSDEDQAGPVRLAAAFTRFGKAGDRERLVRRVVEGRFARAA